MSDLPQLTGPTSGPAGGRTPRQLVLLLHVLGADGNDLIGLAPYFARVLPDAKFVSPCDMAPMGYQWFSLQDRTDEAVLQGARMARPILDRFIDEQMAALGLGPADTALVGFSQGTMMSLFAGLRRDQPVAGILGYSGRLVGAGILADEISVKPPVTLINGDQDELIPASVQPAAVNALKDLGIEVEGHIRPGLGHSIDPVGIELGCEFLARVFA